MMKQIKKFFFAEELTNKEFMKMILLGVVAAPLFCAFVYGVFAFLFLIQEVVR